VRLRPIRSALAAGFAVCLLVSACAAPSKPTAGAPPATSRNAGADPQSIQQTVGASPAVKASPTPTTTPKPSATAAATSAAKACSVLPSNDVWHANISRLPVAKLSAAYVSSIGAGAPVHADFGSGRWDGAPIGIPITTVPAGQKKIAVSFQYASESDKGPYPVPKNAKIEGGTASSGDRHVILFAPSTCTDYELYAAYPRSGGAWTAGSGAIFDLAGNALRPAGWTSADAAGLPILPGLVTYAEVASGRINHAIRVTVPASQAAYLWPARHQASSSHDSSLPPMGLRLRLKAGVDISHLPTQARIVAQAMKTYGVIVADNGSPWYISGAPDARWNNDALHALGTLTGADFEAVDESSLEISDNSGAAR
jgi:hypothetical protein